MTTTEPRPPRAGATDAARDHARDLHRVVAAQADLIAQLQRRLDRLEGERPAPADRATSALPPSARADASGLDAPTSRRHLMTKGAAAAASAVIGTAAVGLATASPAAAASGTFDGDPAVTATASLGGTAVMATSSGSEAVVAVTDGGFGTSAVLGVNYATSGTAYGVLGSSDSPEGIAVRAINNAATGEALAVMGHIASPTGTAVKGYNEAVTGAHSAVLGLTASSSGRGVEGRSTAAAGDTNGVFGNVNSTGTGKGVAGVANAGTGANFGVWGRSNSTAGTGVHGVASASTGTTYGIAGQTASAAGTAVSAVAAGNGTGVASTSNRTQLLLAGTPAAPPGAGLARVKGEMVFDTNADLWICVASGTPGTWRKVAGPTTAGAFTILPSTIRIYDSRPGTNPLNVPKGQLGNQQIRTLDATIGGAVPTGATAVLVNLTIVNTGDPGYLALYKNGIPYPGNSTINWNQPNTLLANSAVVALDDQARFAVKANVGFCDFVVDVIGSYR